MSKVVRTIDPSGRHVIDVSDLPGTALGPRSPVWWGNTLLMFVESTTMALLVAIYFYLRQNFEEWPPPLPMVFPPVFHPVPDLPLPTVETLVILGSCAMMMYTTRAAKRLDASRVRVGLWVMFALVLAIIAMRFFEFPGLKFKWRDNAYGSITWTLLGMHLTYLLAGAGEFFIMGVWVVRHGIDEEHALDVTLAAIYWYWVAVTWVIVYALVYFGARVL